MSTAVIVHDTQQGVMHAHQRGALLRPIAPLKEIIAAKNDLDELIVKSLEDGLDFGQVPGAKKTDKKRILYKSGAERVNGWHGVVPRYEIVEKEVNHDVAVPWRKKKYNNRTPDDRSYTEVDGESLGVYRYVIRCLLVHRASGEVVGEGLGSCSTLESKYIDRPRDLENTVLKIAKKRAYVDGTLTTYALSDRFTQDLEDMKREDDDEEVTTEKTRPVEQQEAKPEDVDERGIAVMMFGAEAIKGKAIDDVGAISVGLLASTIEWIEAEKNANAKARFPNLAKQLEPELLRRVRAYDMPLDNDDVAKTIKWVRKNEAREKRFDFLLTALAERSAYKTDANAAPADEKVEAAETVAATEAAAP